MSDAITTETTETTTESKAGQGPDLAKVVESLISKHGDAASAVRVLLSETHDLRDKNRDLKARIPADGAVILTGDDATAWSAYRQLGKPDEVKAKLTRHDELDGQVRAHAREKVLGQAAAAHGYDAEVLAQLAGDLPIRLDDRTVNGKPAKVAVVVGKAEDGKETVTDLDKHAEAAWAKFLPSLKAQQATNPPRGGTGAGRAATPPPPVGARHAESGADSIGIRMPKL